MDDTSDSAVVALRESIVLLQVSKRVPPLLGQLTVGSTSGDDNRVYLGIVRFSFGEIHANFPRMGRLLTDDK